MPERQADSLKNRTPPMTVNHSVNPQRSSMSISHTLSPLDLFITIIHETLFQLSTKPALRIRSRTAPSLQCFPPRSIHVHPHHQFSFVVIDADIVVIGHMGPRPP